MYGVFFYKTEIMESTLDTRIDMHFYRIGKVNCDSICFKDTIMPRKASSRARSYLMDGGGGLTPHLHSPKPLEIDEDTDLSRNPFTHTYL